jgi:hypothetical protein
MTKGQICYIILTKEVAYMHGYAGGVSFGFDARPYDKAQPRLKGGVGF